jgi:hypothetical protein
VWVARLTISDSVEQKLIHKHHVDPQDVRHALERVKSLNGRASQTKEGRWRLLIKITIRGKPHLAVLFPSYHNGEEFHLATCHPLT